MTWSGSGRKGGTPQGLFEQSCLCPFVSEWPRNICLPNVYSFPSSCESHSFSFKSQSPKPFSLLQNDICTSFGLTAFGISVSVWIPHKHKIKFDFLLLICLISTQFSVWIEGPWRGQEILSPWQMRPNKFSSIPWDCVSCGENISKIPDHLCLSFASIDMHITEVSNHWPENLWVACGVSFYQVWRILP